MTARSHSWRVVLVIAGVLGIAGVSLPTAAYATARTITAVSPSSGQVGTPVTITGTGLSAATTVKFDGVSVGTRFKVKNGTTITTSVPAFAGSGPVTVTMPGGAATSPSPFTLTLGIEIERNSGPPTSSVVVDGSGFGANEGVDVFFDSADVGLIVAVGNGTFGTFALTVPTAAIPGAHWITALGRRTQAGAQKLFTVRADWPQLGYSSKHRGKNPYENVLSPSTVAGIDRDWSYTTGGPLFSSPAIANGVAYIGSTDGKLEALDAATGALDWSYATAGNIFSSPRSRTGSSTSGRTPAMSTRWTPRPGCSTGRTRPAPSCSLRRRSRTGSSTSAPTAAPCMR